MTARQAFEHLAYYGQRVRAGEQRVGPVPEGFTLNTPVGVCMDRCGQIWVCDTGNNRVVVFDRELQRICAILDCPDPASALPGAQTGFRLPFHLCLHPEKPWIYITDMGNRRVVTMAYAPDSFSFVHAFGNTSGPRGAALMDPNGITVVQRPGDAPGQYSIYVNDEFYREPGDPDPRLRNRCVRFNEAGEYQDEFRSVIDPAGVRHDLYWPQGLSSDHMGNLYIANTGHYEVLKCPSAAPIDGDLCKAADAPVVSHRFGAAKGVGMLGIMRSVRVIGERVFVPDHIANSISVYALDGREITTVTGILPTWNHDGQQVDSPTDPLYYALENAALVSPYGICPGEAPDVFVISEPFCSRIMKVRIADFSLPEVPVEILAAVGGRRDEPAAPGGDSQFNCITAVVSLKRRRTGGDGAAFDALAELPAHLRDNPIWTWGLRFGQAVARQYDYWFGPLSRRLIEGTDTDSERLRLNLDAGNWEIRAYLETPRDFVPAGTPVTGYFLPGNIAMAVYHPREPLFGQLVPGTPILFVSNFTVGSVSMYQLAPGGELFNYGIPFGTGGKPRERLHGPQGMAVSDDGEIFVVDALKHRLTKWRLLPNGQVVFIRGFAWPDARQQPFTPTDVAIDADNRLFVTDQFNNRLCVFDRHGKPLWTCGQRGYWEEGEPDGDRFMLPTSLAVDGGQLIVNDLVNRALKRFDIGADRLTFAGGVSLFKRPVDDGGVWMPFFLHAQDGQVYVADSTYNVVQVFRLG